MAAGRGDGPHKAAACFSSGKCNHLVHAAVVVVRHRLRPLREAATVINAPVQILFIWSVLSRNTAPPGLATGGHRHVRVGGVAVGHSDVCCFVSSGSQADIPYKALLDFLTISLVFYRFTLCYHIIHKVRKHFGSRCLSLLANQSFTRNVPQGVPSLRPRLAGCYPLRHLNVRRLCFLEGELAVTVLQRLVLLLTAPLRSCCQAGMTPSPAALGQGQAFVQVSLAPPRRLSKIIRQGPGWFFYGP